MESNVTCQLCCSNHLVGNVLFIPHKIETKLVEVDDASDIDTADRREAVVVVG